MSNADIAKVAIFDTHPTVDVPVEPPLAYSFHRSGTPSAGPRSGVVIREHASLEHLILRGGAIVLDEALRDELGLNLPGQPQGLSFDTSGERSLQWLSPDEWLLIVPGGEAFELENRLRARLGDAHYSIVNVSGGQTLLELEGNAVRELLMKTVIYDVHPHSFPVGKGVTTVFAKATAIVRRPSEERWELVIRRSFADYCYRWLLDAGEEYGIGIAS